MKLLEIIEKMNEVYTDSREQLATIYAALDEASATEQRVRADAHLTESDRATKLQALRSESWRLRDKLQQIEQNAHSKIDSLAEQAAAANTPKAADVDEKALALIDSGVLNANELLAIGDQYSGNSAMLRLIGGRLVNLSEDSPKARFDRMTAAALRDKGRELQILGQAAPAADIASNFADGLKAGCRADRALADAAHRAVYDSALADARAQAAALDAEPTA